jgi:hypothetical protein
MSQLVANTKLAPRRLIAARGQEDIFRPTGLHAPGACAGATTLERATLVLTHGAPDAGVLPGLQRPAQAFTRDGAPLADSLGFGDLQQGRPGVADGKEEFGVFVATNRAVTPVHWSVLLGAIAGFMFRLG